MPARIPQLFASHFSAISASPVNDSSSYPANGGSERRLSWLGQLHQPGGDAVIARQPPGPQAWRHGEEFLRSAPKATGVAWSGSICSHWGTNQAHADRDRRQRGDEDLIVARNEIRRPVLSRPVRSSGGRWPLQYAPRR